MRLQSATPAQRECIRHLDGPLFVAAGAGSGKTYTLQQRIAYALLPDSGPFCSSIDEILAITFMEKAAAEIKSRVRTALRLEGMIEEALKVDAAWISTIHGMCSRILRENALAAGVDVDFEVLGSFDERAMRDVAVERVLARARRGGRLDALFAEYGARGGGFHDTSVSGMARTLLDKTSSFHGAAAAVDVGPEPPRAGEVAESLRKSFAQASSLVEDEMRRKPTQTQLSTHAACLEAVAALEEFLHTGSKDYWRLGGVLERIELPTKTGFGRKSQRGAQMAARLGEELSRAFDNVNAGIVRPLAGELLALARLVDEEYRGMLDEQGALDNDGLLHRTLELLDGNPEVARGYRRRFKLVMVDEFQDTNQLQVDLISRVAGTEHLCTVGDAQQSIYRFNGADVAVFERQRRRIQADESGRSRTARLDDNFRSHGDVLAFVRRVCGQNEVFGDDFLDLRASRTERGAYKGTGPRVEVHLTTYEGRIDDSGAVRSQADYVAERFAELRECGHAAGEMVVLLSAMTKADAVADALRARGFSCVLSGGRGFYAAPEVACVRNALAVLANPRDTEALLSLLTSEVFNLSADDVLRLGTRMGDDGAARTRPLDEGLREESGALRAEGSDAWADAAEGCSEALERALRVVGRAQARVGAEDPSRIVLRLAGESGWLERLEAQGVEGAARAGNVLKALRTVEDLERRAGAGIAAVACGFRNLAEVESDGPGSLSVSDGDAVRIMTVHKSKGLEFPIVAVLGCEPRAVSRSAFQCETTGGRVRLALSASKSKAEFRKRPKDVDGDEVDAAAARDAADFAARVRRGAYAEELAEARRKFYVACTRASEYLLVCGLVKKTKKNPLGAYASTPVFDDVRRALVGTDDFPEDRAMLGYGGSAPALFTRRHCAHGVDDAPAPPAAEQDAAAAEQDAAAAEQDAAAAGPSEPPAVPAAEPPVDDAPEPPAFAAPRELPDELPVRLAPSSDVRAGVFSYSSISEVEEERASVPAPAGAQVVLGEEPVSGPRAVDLGLAFHEAAELAVLRRASAGGLVAPEPGRVDAVARAHGVCDPASRARLDGALARWFSSDAATRAASAEVLRAEVPFLAPIDCGGERLLLDGLIDLLACDAACTRAFVVDYKTGGSDEEDAGYLVEKHRLQASCYAYALLERGFTQVEMAFVRVERPDAARPDQPQVVPYRFAAGDLPVLREGIERAYLRSRR